MKKRNATTVRQPARQQDEDAALARKLKRLEKTDRTIMIGGPKEFEKYSRTIKRT